MEYLELFTNNLISILLEQNWNCKIKNFVVGFKFRNLIKLESTQI